MPGFSIATLNVRAGGFTNYSGSESVPPRLPQIREAVATIDASVMGLIDTFRWRELYTAADLRESFGYANVFHIDMNCEAVDPRVGLCLLAQDSLVDVRPVRLYDRNCVRALIQINGTLTQFYVAYLTSFSGQRRRQQVEALLRDADTRPKVPTLIMGDLNTLRPERLAWPVRMLGRVKRSLPSTQRRSLLTEILGHWEPKLVEWAELNLGSLGHTIAYNDYAYA